MADIWLKCISYCSVEWSKVCSDIVFKDRSRILRVCTMLSRKLLRREMSFCSSTRQETVFHTGKVVNLPHSTVAEFNIINKYHFTEFCENKQFYFYNGMSNFANYVINEFGSWRHCRRKIIQCKSIVYAAKIELVGTHIRKTKPRKLHDFNDNPN